MTYNKIFSQKIIFAILILFFLSFSFYPTIFELQKRNQLIDSNREFILEHNYYWPDFNLYLSKIRQGYEGRLTALEKYTSEKHAGSLIQEFYVILGLLGRILNLTPNFSYQLARLILAPLLLFVILALVRFYFPCPSTRSSHAPEYYKAFFWQILALVVTIVSGSFPRLYTDVQGTFHIGRYMEWWSNIDSLQRITFIPHILFGQVVSFYLLYHLTMKPPAQITMRQFIFFILLGNLTGLVFPPSLITLIGVLLLLILVCYLRGSFRSCCFTTTFYYLLFIIFSLPSLLYLFVITKQIPWSALVEFHRTHPMMIPFDQYFLGTGPIFILGMLGAIVSIFRREKRWQPLIFWILTTFSFAVLFSIIKEQSPLRFTQTGLFIPLGLLGTYLFQQIWLLINNRSTVKSKVKGQRLNEPKPKIVLLKITFIALIILYLLENLYIMKVSLDWQTSWISQRVNATTPLVPSPPQTMYPLKSWMDGIRWLRDNTDHSKVVLAQITAGNYIPAYSGNTVYFGQANTVDYEEKRLLIDKFFKGKMNNSQAKLFLTQGRIKYIFFSVQEKEMLAGKNISDIYPFLTPLYENPLVTIFTTRFSN